MLLVAVLIGGGLWLATTDFGESAVPVAESDGSFETAELARHLRLQTPVDGFAVAELNRMLRLAP